MSKAILVAIKSYCTLSQMKIKYFFCGCPIAPNSFCFLDMLSFILYAINESHIYEVSRTIFCLLDSFRNEHYGDL